jgi:hypothetical protein
MPSGPTDFFILTGDSLLKTSQGCVMSLHSTLLLCAGLRAGSGERSDDTFFNETLIFFCQQFKIAISKLVG